MIKFIDAPPLIERFEDDLSAWLEGCCLKHSYTIKMASYSFLSKNEMVASNRKHLNHDYLTDIITFNYSESARLNVELLISYDYIFEQSALSARNLVDEVDRVLVHGLLHCMGFDDQNQGQQKLMREEEKKCLLLRPKKLKFRTIQ